VSVTIGSWGIPLLVTIAAFGWAAFASRDYGGSGYGADIGCLIYAAAAVIISLIAWLAWALIA
jgi:hypothetical protein